MLLYFLKTTYYNINGLLVIVYFAPSKLSSNLLDTLILERALKLILDPVLGVVPFSFCFWVGNMIA